MKEIEKVIFKVFITLKFPAKLEGKLREIEKVIFEVLRTSTVPAKLERVN